MLKILHIGLGPLGQRILSDLYERKLGRVVAAVDSSPEIAGRQLVGWVPGADPDLVVLPSLDKLPSWTGIDAAIVTTSSDLRRCMPTFQELLDKKLAVVSTCEELVWPWLRHREIALQLQERALRGGGRLLGTGVNPGFVMDALPLFATAVSKSVRGVRVFRIQDASTRRIPFQQKIGAGLEELEFHARAAAGTIRHVGLGESLHFLAHFLGFAIESWSETIHPVLAERDLDSALGKILKGRVAGVRQVAVGQLQGREAIRLEFQAAIGQADPHDRIVIEGDPHLDLRIAGGVHGDTATSSIVLNAIRPLVRAKAGLHTMATLPLIYHATGQ